MRDDLPIISPVQPDPRAAMAPHPGEASTVLCLHGSLGFARQWQSLAAALQPRYQVAAPDLLGYASRGRWRAGAPLCLADEAAPLAAMLERRAEPAHLVAHSYGGAVALKLALQRPDLVASLTLYEPVCFGLLQVLEPAAATSAEIRGCAATTVALVREGALQAAARCFVDYWRGRGCWDAQPRGRQGVLAAGMTKVAAEWGALFTETVDLGALRTLPVPVHLLCGLDTAAPARRVVELLGQLLARVSIDYVPGMTHMAPVTDAGRVDPLLARSVDRFAGDGRRALAA